MTPRQLFITGSLILTGAVGCHMLLQHNPKLDNPVGEPQVRYGNPTQAFNQSYARVQVINLYLGTPTTDYGTAQALKQERTLLQSRMRQIVSQTPMADYTDNMRPYLSTGPE